ncbi:MAG TPA: hypothetical protein VL200_03240 [Lacunisphaera sp.]|nr:hypothetical protein [Lacunisphaera sp.]
MAQPMAGAGLAFAELAGLVFYPEAQGSLSSRAAALSSVRRRVERDTAVLATNEWVNGGRALDFVVVFDLGLAGYDSSEPIKSEVLDFFRAIPTERILLLPGSRDLTGDDGRLRYAAFLKCVRVAIPQKTFYDLTTEAAVMPGYTFVGIDSSRLPSATGPAEILRLHQVLRSVAGPIIFFCQDMDVVGGPVPVAKWTEKAEIRQGIAEVVSAPLVSAVFGAPGNWPDHQSYARPFPWWSAGTKSWITTELRGEFETRGGIHFVTVDVGGDIRVMPRFFDASQDAEFAASKWPKLTEGDVFLEAEDFPTAIAAYREAMASTNREVAQIAGKRLQVALQAKEANERPFAQVIYWIRHYGLIVLLAVGSAGLLWWILGILALPFRGDPFQKPWRIKVISEPVESLPSDLYVEEFRLTVATIVAMKELMRRKRVNFPQVDFNRFVPSVAESWGAAIPSGQLLIGQVDVGNLVKLWMTLVDHFSWRLEIRLYNTGSGLVAYSALCWGNERDRLWQVEGAATVPGLKEAARNMAYEIYSEPWVKN